MNRFVILVFTFLYGCAAPPPEAKAAIDSRACCDRMQTDSDEQTCTLNEPRKLRKHPCLKTTESPESWEVVASQLSSHQRTTKTGFCTNHVKLSPHVVHGEMSLTVFLRIYLIRLDPQQ